jgi:G3E family GTPase
MIPVTIIGGYLGAGKTTLINSLLRDPGGRRIAVLVNDFGGINVDASLIASSNATTIALTNGCACCVLSDDLGEAFTSVANATPPFDEIIVEASGVADPRRLAEWAHLPGLRQRSVIVLADVVTILDRVDDAYLGKTVRRQLVGADIVILTKTELVTSGSVAAVRQLVAVLAPSASITTASADEPWTLFNDCPTPRVQMWSGDVETLSEPHSSVHTAYTFQFTRPVFVEEVNVHFGQPIAGLVRAKGFVPVGGTTRPFLLQVVGSTTSLTPVEVTDDRSQKNLVVVIGIDGLFDVQQFAHAVSLFGLVRV